MEPLFLTKKVLEKEADVRLSQNSDEWRKEILEHLHQAYPWLTDAKIQVNFNRMDVEAGAAVGQVQLGDKASIPIIVENFKLQPLDVFWSGGKLRPLTKSGLQEMLQGVSLGNATEPGEGESSDMALFSRTQPPYDGRYIYASELGIRADEIQQAANEAFDSAEELGGAMNDNPAFRQVFRDWVAAGRMTKEAAVKPPTGPSLLARNKLPTQMNRIKTGGLWNLPMALKKTACIVADSVINLNGDVIDDAMAAFEIEGDRYCFGSQFFGEPAEMAKEAEYGNAPAGWGSFILQRKGAVIATEPVQVVGRGSDGEIDKIAVMTLQGPRNIFVSDSVKDWVQLDNGDIIVSSDWTFKKCGRLEKVSGYMAGDSNGQDGLKEVETDLAAAAKETSPSRAAFGRRNLFKEATAIKSAASVFPLSNPAGTKFMKVALIVSDNDAKRTVDALLGLNFITPENSYKFVDQVEKISTAKEACAKLLLASRLGLPLSQPPLKTAMYALDSAERDLRQFSHTVEERTSED